MEGSLSKPEGSIVFNSENPAASTFALKVLANTIDTGIGLRNQHLKSNEYFDAARYPYLKFQSVTLSPTDVKNTYMVSGDLTIKDRTKRIQIPVTVITSSGAYTFRGKFEIDRRDFGVGKNSLSLADEVMIGFEIVTATPL